MNAQKGESGLGEGSGKSKRKETGNFFWRKFTNDCVQRLRFVPPIRPPKPDFCILTPVTSKSRSNRDINVSVAVSLSDAPTLIV